MRASYKTASESMARLNREGAVLMHKCAILGRCQEHATPIIGWCGRGAARNATNTAPRPITGVLVSTFPLCRYGVRAGTDVTGFGITGASRDPNHASCRIDASCT